MWPLSGKMLRLAALLVPVLLFGVTLGADTQGAGRDPATPGSAVPVLTGMLRGLPLAFEPNQGQADAQVMLVARGAGYRIFLNAQEAVLALGADKNSWLHIRPVGANPSPLISALEELPGKSNYLDGAAPSTWHTNIPNYARVLYRDVYPGIDLAYHGNEGKLEYDWVVRPGADPAAIRLSFPGARRVRLDGGELAMETAAGELRNRQPAAYQDIGGTRRYVAASYVLERGQRASFRLGPYDTRAPLIIDPTIVYIKPLPGPFGAQSGPVIDAAGGLYFLLTGYDAGGNLDPQAVMKLNASGTLVFSAELGFLGATKTVGGYSSAVAAMAVDSAGNIYLAGSSGAGLATTPGALQPNLRGQANGFVAKLNPTGSAILYSTFVGGSSQDFARAIAVDSAGSAYIAGRTTSADFPTTPGVLGACGSARPSFVAKLNALGTALVYSGCVAAGNFTNAVAYFPAIAADAAGNLYAAGSTISADFPTTPGAFQTKFAAAACGGGNTCPRAFVFKLNPTGSAFVYSTLLGGQTTTDAFHFLLCGDEVTGMALDASGNVYVAGVTCSADFPFTPGALKAGGTFIAKLNPAGSGLVYAAGLPAPPGSRIAVDAGGNVYAVGTVAGYSSDTDSSLVDPIQAEFGAGSDLTYCSGLKGPGCYNAFILKLNATGTALLYSTYFGWRDFGDGIAVDSSGNAYVNVSGYLLLKLADAGSSPLFSSKGVTNAATFQPGIVPGGLATLFGTNITNVQGVLTANSFPLPTILGGSQVFVNTCTIPADALYCLPAPVAAPILAVANVNGQQQINFQVPGAISEGVPVWVVNNGVRSVPVSLHSGLPGIFTTDGVRGAIQHAADFRPVTPANPAVRAEPVVMYATGLGAVQPDPGAGYPASPSPLSLTSSTTIVTVGGKWALVLFSGLAPGFVGLSQINFLVPADAPSGDDDVIVAVSSGGRTAISKPVKLAVR